MIPQTIRFTKTQKQTIRKFLGAQLECLKEDKRIGRKHWDKEKRRWAEEQMIILMAEALWDEF
tara:strand:+ start:27401 stop:27589 length:189 start_codon:yes stop_codon:yes gene_type:complete